MNEQFLQRNAKRNKEQGKRGLLIIKTIATDVLTARVAECIKYMADINCENKGRWPRPEEWVPHKLQYNRIIWYVRIFL